MPERLFRCAGDIQFDDVAPTLEHVTTVKLKPFSETCNYLQYQRPLTAEHPSFCAQIQSLTSRSVVTIGIAGPDINDDVHPGCWNRSVGYQNNGTCYSSHLKTANTKGHQFTAGDVFGVLVSHFGKDKSTVIFFKNGYPVATRYLYEPDHQCFLPTIALENGPVELGLLWPEAMLHQATFSERNMLHWIRPPEVKYDKLRNVFYAEEEKSSELIIQSPLALSQSIQHYEVAVLEVGETGAAPTIGITSCSKLEPAPTCPLMNDYFKWHPDGKLLKMKAGQRVGWGLHFNPAVCTKPGFCDKEEQLVLCYVTVDATIAYAKIVLQPSGGWYPVIILHPYASRVSIDIESRPHPIVSNKLDQLFSNLIPEAQKLLHQDKLSREISMNKFRKSDAVKVCMGDTFTTVTLPRDRKGIHVVQLLEPLTVQHRYFSLEVRKAGDSSVVSIGVTGMDFPLNRYPGRLKGTVGYQSRDGKMFYNDKDGGNMAGKRYGKGDQVGLEIEVFDVKMSVALLSKNGLPVGTRFITGRQYLPTIALCGNGSEVEVDVVWQTRIAAPPIYSVTSIEHWCLPERARADPATNFIYVEPGHTEAEAIQAPYSLHRKYNHFEVEVIDDFDDAIPPPAIALCTASPFDPTPKSNFKGDFIRFWATGEAQKAVKKGDLMGWGMLYPDEAKHHDQEQLVICYLTINRDVALTRVMYQPPGGFYPVVLIPPGVDRVKLNFGATVIVEHPFTPAAIQVLLQEAEEMILDEERHLATGADPEEWDSEENKAKYLRPVPKMDAVDVKEAPEKFRDSPFGEDRLERKKPPKMANLVELMMKLEEDKKENMRVQDNFIKNDSEGNGSGKQTSKTCILL